MCRLKRRSAVALRVVALLHWLFSQQHYQLRDQAVPLVLCLITITLTAVPSRVMRILNKYNKINKKSGEGNGEGNGFVE